MACDDTSMEVQRPRRGRLGLLAREPAGRPISPEDVLDRAEQAGGGAVGLREDPPQARGRGGLPVRPGDADDAQQVRWVAQEEGGHLPHGIPRPLDQEVRHGLGRGALGEHGGSTPAYGLGYEGVAVGVLALGGDEEVPRSNGPRVDGYARQHHLAVNARAADLPPCAEAAAQLGESDSLHFSSLLMAPAPGATP
jgi:hypothetical protein